MAKQEDHELVAAVVSGDADAFEELLERYEKTIFNLALRITGSREDAADATQSAFLNAFDHLRDFDSQYRFFSWIYRIGLNEALKLVERKRRFVVLEGDLAEERGSPERQALGSEIGDHVQSALLELPVEQRAPLVLRHFHGLSYDEMADVLDIPAKTVKSRLFSARRALRQRIEALGLAPGRRRAR